MELSAIREYPFRQQRLCNLDGEALDQNVGSAFLCLTPEIRLSIGPSEKPADCLSAVKSFRSRHYIRCIYLLASNLFRTFTIAHTSKDSCATRASISTHSTTLIDTIVCRPPWISFWRFSIRTSLIGCILQFSQLPIFNTSRTLHTMQLQHS